MSCAFAALVGGICGPSATNSALATNVTFVSCVKDVQKHLSSLKVAKTAALSEANLILARAGAVNL